jgi:hypothetical protein
LPGFPSNAPALMDINLQDFSACPSWRILDRIRLDSNCGRRLARRAMKGQQ